MKIGIYAELDAILDTRLATLARIDQEAAMAVDIVAYRDRMSDQFAFLDPKFTDAAYREMYARRDVYTLMLAAPTLFAFTLNEVVRVVEDAVIRNRPMVDEISLDINMWPYNLTDEETRLICQSVGARAGIAVPVNPVYISPDKMTTAFIKRHGWSILHIYNFDEWFSSVFSPQVMPELVPEARLVVPKLFKSVEAAQAYKEKFTGKKGMDPLTATALSLAPIIAVEYLTAHEFSFVDPVDLLAPGEKIEETA